MLEDHRAILGIPYCPLSIMLEAAFSFLSEVVAFHLGRAYLWVLTLGRYRPHIDDRSQPLVSLFGFLVTFAAAIGAVMWLL